VVAKTLQAPRRRQPDGETRKEAEGPRERVRLPGKGKLWRGSSRDASGMKEGREALGSTAHGGVQKASSEPRDSRNRREGQEP